MTIIAVSGGFDPIHIGHIRMIQESSEYGDVYVILNSDGWLERKKGYIFMPWHERCEILKAIDGVKEVVAAGDIDDTVCHALRVIMPDYFANGGDRTESNTPEKKLCEELGITMLWNIGGGKVASSSELVANVRR